MEWHCDHWSDLTEVDLDHSVIISNIPRIQFFVCLWSSVDRIEILYLFIGSPDGGQAGCLGRHNIHTDTEINAQVRHTRPYKFHDFILHIAFIKHFTDNGKGNVLRSNPFLWCSGQVNAYNARHINIVCFIQ